MSDDWQLVFDEAAFEFFLSRKASERRFLLSTFARLKADPYQSSDYFACDNSGRQLSVKAFQPFLITFWLDHAVSEIRVLDIERIRF